MDIWITVALTLGGVIVSIVLKFSEYRFAIAKEKFQRRLLAYEQISLHAFRLGIATLVDPGNAEAEEIREESWSLLQKQLLQSLPLLSPNISEKVGDILSKQADVTKRDAPQEEKMELVRMAASLVGTIRSELRTGESTPALERVLLGIKRVG